MGQRKVAPDRPLAANRLVPGFRGHGPLRWADPNGKLGGPGIQSPPPTNGVRMSVDSGIIRAEPHLEIGLLLQRDVEILVERWSRRAVEEQPKAKRVHHQALVDHFHEFLKALGRSLAESDDSATFQHCLPAGIHGEQRWETGWSLPEVVHDYGILRLVILDYLDEVLDAPVGLRALMAIGLALDEAIAASVTMYVNSRDGNQRQMEEERAQYDRRIQEHLRQKAETLNEVDRRKNEFMAILGHEMRNPLAPLSHVVHLLEMPELTGEMLLHVREITQRQVDQLTRLADDLLDISRIAQGKVELRKERLNLLEVASHAVQISAPHVKMRAQRFEFVAGKEPLWLWGDSARLLQILGNLLNNATKYTHHGGSIRFSVERDGNSAVIRVCDCGVGIPADLLPHIFELFTQGEWSGDESRGGMGIGLALVRRLVELHGGTIKASSGGPNQGSEFEVRLPLLLESLPSLRLTNNVAAGNAPASAQSQRRVLVVDDNVDVANTMCMLLSIKRHEVRVAHDGAEALGIAEDFRPDVILLDLGLPVMDGYELARRLRQQQATKDAFLIALTGYAHDDDRKKSKDAGFDLHLVKPVRLDELEAAIAQP
jgi:signal transduction histidine kinase